jgi:hypothetical protein
VKGIIPSMQSGHLAAGYKTTLAQDEETAVAAVFIPLPSCW